MDWAAAVEGRLLDFDDRVRMQAVIVVCDLAKSNLKFLRPELISRATDRLRDKKVVFLWTSSRLTYYNPSSLIPSTMVSFYVVIC